jgi:hypothetical protein
VILANIASLERLISRLRRREAGSTWSDYAPTTSYSEEDAARKARFVHEALATRRLGLAWDLGCNDGRHARIAAEHADYVVAVDGDELVGDRLYEALKREGATRILPLTMDLVDPSPGLGWRGLERRSLIERGRPDATLCLALVHHVSIGGNVPIRDIVDWLATLGASS